MIVGAAGIPEWVPILGAEAVRVRASSARAWQQKKQTSITPPRFRTPVPYRHRTVLVQHSDPQIATVKTQIEEKCARTLEFPFSARGKHRKLSPQLGQSKRNIRGALLREAAPTS